MTALPLDHVEGQERVPARVDVVVIGGGIVGVSTALFLAESGLSVALCEKGRIAGEQSGRNWGWVRQMGRDVVEIPLAIESLKLWSTMNHRIGDETGFRRTGITYLCESRRDIAAHEKWLTHAKLWRVPSRVVSPAALARLLPGIAGHFRGGLHTANDGRAEPTKAAPAIARAAQRAGAHILTGCAVRGLDMKAGRLSGVVTESGPIACEAAVLAGGAWSRLFLGNLGVDLPQLKIIGSVARVSGVEGVPEMPVGASNFSFRKRLDGGFSVAMRNANIAPVVPDSFRLFTDFVPSLVKQWRELKLRVGSRFIEEWQTPRRWALDKETPFERVRMLDPVPIDHFNRRGLANLVKAFPAFADARITHSWSGIIDVTPDAVPVIGPVAGLPGLFMASGFSGHGFGIGPGAGRLTADLVLDRDPCVDPRPFRFERFVKASKTAERMPARQTGG